MDWTIPKAAALGSVLAARDLAWVGLWHPGLWAWRLGDSVAGALRGARFGDHLAARRNGQPGQAFAQGDTPWTVLAQVARWLSLGPRSTFVDVGAGQGLAAGVLCAISGARGFAVEPLEPFRREAQRAYAALGLPVTAVARLEEVPLAAVDAAYGAWTCVDAPARAELVGQLQALRPGAGLVTVTHPAAAPGFALERTETRWFPWGSAQLHVHRRVDPGARPNA